MQDAVETTVVVLDRLREALTGVFVEVREIRRYDDGAGLGVCRDGVEDGLQLAPRTPEEHYLCAMARIGEGGRPADAVPRPGDQHDASGEQIRRRPIARPGGGHAWSPSLRACTR